MTLKQGFLSLLFISAVLCLLYVVASLLSGYVHRDEIRHCKEINWEWTSEGCVVP